MSKLSNSKLLSIITKLLVLILSAKLVSLGLWWYLPSSGIEYEESNSYTPSYKRIDFKNMLIQSKVLEQEGTKTSVSTNINTILLQGLYGNAKSGYAILAKKSDPKKTSVVGIGEEYEGYTLKSIQLSSVLFTKMGKEYILKMQTQDKREPQKYVTQNTAAQESHAVAKTDISFYRTNPTKLWQDIAINEVVEGKEITGFRVDRIKKDSKIAQLGLQKGDVIIRANNIELTSYKAAMDLYKKIDSIDVLELVVLRNNQEKEIVYEVH